MAMDINKQVYHGDHTEQSSFGFIAHTWPNHGQEILPKEYHLSDVLCQGTDDGKFGGGGQLQSSTHRSPLRDLTSEKHSRFEGGATRTEKAERYDLVPPEAVDAIARRIGLGVAKHGENNWKSGGVAFIKATFNHMLAHISSLRKLNLGDQDLDAIICNVAFLCWFKENKSQEYYQALTELQHP